MTKINEHQAAGMDQTQLVAVRGTRQTGLIEQLLEVLDLDSDAALARAMETQPPVISKLRRGTLPFSALYIIAVHEMMENRGLAGWSVREIKARLGLRRVGDPV